MRRGTSFRGMSGAGLQGRRIVVTGATGGLGNAICRRLAAEGASLTVVGRDADALGQLAATLDADSCVADLADGVLSAELLDLVADADVLVVASGAETPGPEAPDHAVDRCLQVNLGAPVHLSNALIRSRTAKRPTGHVVLIGSLSSFIGLPGSAPYTASKFGLRGFALTLRQEAPWNAISVSLVHPGFVRDAGMFANSGMRLHRWIRSCASDDVAAGVVRALRSARSEVLVAPWEQRVIARVAVAVPTVAEALLARVSPFRAPV